MSEERRRPQRPKVDSGRDQRIFSSSIRSALGTPRNQGRRSNATEKVQEPSYQSIDEALKELGRALEQPSTSLDEFETYIRQNASKFGDQECQEVATKLMEYALKSSEFRFLLKICSDCIRHLNLMDAIAQEILLAASEYFSNNDQDNNGSVPELFGHIVAAKWPPGKGKALENVNPVLFVGMNVVLSWITIMKEYGQPKSSPAQTPDSPPSPQEDAEDFGLKKESPIESPKSEDKEVSQDQDKEPEEEHDERTAELATLSICTVCNIAQRNFWLNFMETFDDVFAATKHLLVSPEAKLSKSVKTSLLQLYISLFKWSATNQPKFTSIASQTQ